MAAGVRQDGDRTLNGLRSNIENLRESGIREVYETGRNLPGLIPLWFGEPDKPTPDFIGRAASRALEEGKTFYAPNSGVPELRDALAAYSERIYGAPLDPERITVTGSGMQALAISAQLLIAPGDNMVFVTPVWPNIHGLVEIMGGETRDVALDRNQGGFTLDLEKLFAACDSNTRAIFLNSPNNPTGWMMERAEQQALLEFCRRRGIWIVADEVYARLVYDRPHAPSFLEIADPEDRVLVVNSFSKPWAMTGWRLGWLTRPAGLTRTLEKISEYNIAAPTTFVQWAGIEALENGESFIGTSLARYRAGRDLVHDRLNRMDGIDCPLPPGAFYHFFAVDGLTNSLAFCKEVLAETAVGMAPGGTFGDGGEGNVRLCFASSLELLTEAMDRFEDFMNRRGGNPVRA